MASSIRCRISGCDLDDCGVCRRCGSETKAQHEWKEAERNRKCFKLEVCARCEKEKEIPDHDWEASPGLVDDVNLKCARCGMTI